MKITFQSVLFDDIVVALADIQRQTLLVTLLDHNPQDDSPAAVDGSESDILENLVSMDHIHLPKLAEYGFMVWDQETHEVSKGPNFDEIRPLLELLDEHKDELPADWL